MADKDIYWTRSENASTAASALTALLRAVADAQKGKGTTSDCIDLDGNESETNCTAAFLAAAPKVFAVGNCAAPAGGNFIRCYTYEMDRYVVRIVTDISSDGISSTAIEMKDAPIMP